MSRVDLKPFARWLAATYGDNPAAALHDVLPQLQAAAAEVGALFDEADLPALSDLSGRRVWLRNLSGRREQRHQVRASLRRYDDEVAVPQVTFHSYKRGGRSVTPPIRDVLFQRAQRGRVKPDQARDAAYRRAVDEAMERAELAAVEDARQKAEGHAAAAQVARQAWDAAKKADGHKYLDAKGLPCLGLRMAAATIHADLWHQGFGEWRRAIAVRQGELLVPLYDGDGRLTNLQRIDADGNKRPITGGRLRGTHHRIGESGRAWLAEGWATAAAVHIATGAPTVMAVNDGGLTILAESMRGDLLGVAADHDESGAGQRAAEKTGLPWAMPSKPGSDFCDLWARGDGASYVRATLESAKVNFEVHVTPTTSCVRDIQRPRGELRARPSTGMEAVEAMSQHGVFLSTDMRGEPHANLDNAIAVMQGHPRFAGRIWYDTFHQDVYTTWDCDEPRQWVDSDRLRVAAAFQRDFGLVRFGDELIEKAVIAVAQENTRDELRDWLQSLRWDGMPRLGNWLQRAVGTPSDPYHDAIGKNFLISMVARGLMPGCKVDTMPVFEGLQGAGKSRLLAILGGSYYAELTESLDTKDFFVVLQGKWLLEIAELDAFRRTDVTRIKQVLSSQQDRCRLPYAKRATDLPRRAVFAGTTNESEYLRDATGARRFWPLTVKEIDHEWLRSNRDQLLAEAVKEFKDGATWWEVPIDEAKAQADERRETDSWEPIIADWCIGRSGVLICEVLSGIGVEVSRQDKGAQMRAAHALKAIGYSKGRFYRGAKQVRGWVRDNADTETEDSPF